jgi:hypothetical protein
MSFELFEFKSDPEHLVAVRLIPHSFPSVDDGHDWDLLCEDFACNKWDLVVTRSGHSALWVNFKDI